MIMSTRTTSIGGKRGMTWDEGAGQTGTQRNLELGDPEKGGTLLVHYSHGRFSGTSGSSRKRIEKERGRFKR